ncbi:aldehyde dehydrogenase family protein, partial [candidate division KSB1 bacterium]|nr:aldehyde dehydrogenase family protein [candidate division KSB1 bacterium]
MDHIQDPRTYRERHSLGLPYREGRRCLMTDARTDIESDTLLDDVDHHFRVRAGPGPGHLHHRRKLAQRLRRRLQAGAGGGGGDVGAAIVGHADVNMVSFTGGGVAGRAIAEACSRRLAPVVLELGGKSANIVFGDADIDRAVAGAMFAIFHSGGQSCIAGSR